MTTSHPPNTRITQGNNVRTNMSAALAIDYTTTLDVFGDALQRVFGDAKSGAKRLAIAANCNVRTAENILAKRNLPHLVIALRLIATVPELQAEVRRLTGMAADMDPLFERDMQMLFQTWQNIKAVKP